MHFTEIILLIILSVIIYQDFRNRAISWFLLPVVAILGATIALQHIPVQQVLIYTAMNTGFIIFQLIGLTTYYSVKNRTLTNIVNRYIGIGDIFFFFSLCFLFSPVNYIFFIIAGLLFTLVFTGVRTIFLQNTNKTIPVAGTISLTLNIIIIINLLTGHYHFHDDTLINSVIFSHFLNAGL